MSLVQQFTAYRQWRARLAEAIAAFRQWLDEQGLSAAETDECLLPLLERLAVDHLCIAFVAEFSRGKSELINSLFFPDYGCRILPSSVGRTTMCPTELFHLPNTPPAISLLPIETRLDPRTMHELRNAPEVWSHTPLRIDSAEAMQAALRQVSETRRVSPEEALNLGFAVDKADNLWRKGEDGKVEIPRWRHALVNFPHPLLRAGLVILDTPGLNAISAEPELTLSLLPKAHIILFLLAADTGITQSDLAIWQTYIGLHQNRQGRLVALNKIDSLWDPLKSEAELQVEINKQVCSCAEILNLKTAQIFPVSAQKGLLARIHGNQALLEQSRLPELENALSKKLIPSKRNIMRDDVAGNFNRVCAHVQNLLESRLKSVTEQLDELSRLNKKNRSMLESTQTRTHGEKEAFSAALGHFRVTHNLLQRLAGQLFSHLSLSALQTLTHATNQTMQEVVFSRQLSSSMSLFFGTVRENLTKGEAKIVEIHTLAKVAYQRMIAEHALQLPDIAPFTLTRHNKELLRLERWCDTHLNTPANLMAEEKEVITQKFFSEVVAQVTALLETANLDAVDWLTRLLEPLQTQLKERKSHLRRRQKNVQSILDADGSLTGHMTELRTAKHTLRGQIQRLDKFRHDLHPFFLPSSG